MWLKESCFPECWKATSVVPVFKNIGRGLWLKNTTLLAFFLWLGKSGLLITSSDVVSFLIFSMVSGLPNQLQIFSQLYLIELLGFLADLGLNCGFGHIYWRNPNGKLHFLCSVSCGTWYIQRFRQGVTCWSTSQTGILWNIRPGI